MTVAARPDPLPPLRSILDEAFADMPTVADPQPVDTQHALDGTIVVEGWVPTLPPDPHHCPDGICADLQAERAAIHQAADWRTYQAWARDRKAHIRRAKAARRKTARSKKVKAP